jgi:hypothetical protein
MLAGGPAPRYVRLRPWATLSEILDERAAKALPETVNGLVAKETLEILNLRPALCYGVTPTSK